MRHQIFRQAPRHALLACIAVSVAGCGQSAFVKEVTPICEQFSGGGKNCACIIGKLDSGLSDQQKTAFVALRWPLRPDPQDREFVNGEILRSAGIDPTDRQQMRSVQAEFRDTMRAMSEGIRAECGSNL